jgi:hypothetical protein
MMPRPSGWNSVIVPDSPKLFEDFKKKQFTLLWCGSRDGFGCKDFHIRCDGHPNTLTVKRMRPFNNRSAIRAIQKAANTGSIDPFSTEF